MPEQPDRASSCLENPDGGARTSALLRPSYHPCANDRSQTRAVSRIGARGHGRLVAVGGCLPLESRDKKVSGFATGYGRVSNTRLGGSRLLDGMAGGTEGCMTVWVGQGAEWDGMAERYVVFGVRAWRALGAVPCVWYFGNW